MTKKAPKSSLEPPTDLGVAIDYALIVTSAVAGLIALLYLVLL